MMNARARLLLDTLAYIRLRMSAVRITAERRHTYGKALQGISVGVFVLWGAVAFFPIPVHADVLSSIAGGVDPNTVITDVEGLADPVSTIQTSTTQWFSIAQNLARNTFGGLLVIELFMMGFQAILFKDRLGQFFASVAFKVFGIGFFLFLIMDGDVEFKMIFDSFSHSGQQIAGPGGSLAAYVLKGIGLAAMFFAVGIIGQQMDESNAESCSEILGSVQGDVGGDVGGFGDGVDPPGTFNGNVGGVLTGIVKGTVSGNLGCATATPFDHLLYDFICFGLGAMMALSVAVVLLSWALIAAESAIVMTAGVFFLSFAGSRFTTPFSQGYLSYAVNVGIKAFTFWLVIAIQNAMIGKLAEDALGALISNIITAKLAGALGVGLGTVVAYAGGAVTLAVASVAVLECMVMSVIAFSIPNIAATFVSGESALRANHALTGALGALAGGGLAAASFRQASAYRRPSERLLNHEMGRLRNQSTERLGPASGAAPSIFSVSALEPDDSTRRVNGGDTSDSGDDNTASGTPTAPRSESGADGFAPAAAGARYTETTRVERPDNRGLEEYTPQEIREMALTPEGLSKFHDLAKQATKRKLTEQQWRAITAEQTLPNGKRAPNLQAIFDAAGGKPEAFNKRIANRQQAGARAIETAMIAARGTQEEDSGPRVTLGDSGIRQ